ncbi:hypothetical protein EK904_008346 [Melospiza melodia maxima]|nr:hypothetical protein EK904_008346 [Melospiza melodia maxima]
MKTELPFLRETDTFSASSSSWSPWHREGLLSISLTVLCRDSLRGEDEGSRLVLAWGGKEACSERKAQRADSVLSSRSVHLGQRRP